MKATGIVRRIDDLGRVVIPKEIRRTMRIREGDPLEIYTSSDGEVIFKKYSPIGEMGESAAQVAEIMHRLAGCPVAVFDRDHVVSVSGAAKKEWNARRVSPELEELMEQRRQYFSDAGEPEFLPAEGMEKAAVACMPILSAGDVTGAVAFLENDEHAALNETQKSLIQAASQFLGNNWKTKGNRSSAYSGDLFFQTACRTREFLLVKICENRIHP